MLTHLSIKNFGLIESVDLELDPRLNILTGETGAGKSIIIDALRVALGSKMTASQMRDASTPCRIEAQFDLEKSEIRHSEILQDYFQEDDFSLIISRLYSPEGKNTIRVNGSAVTVSQLREIGSHLMDFHGPHDHQMLLNEDSHIRMLDRLAETADLLQEYTSAFTIYRSLLHQMNDLKELAQTRERETDFLEHQLKELGNIHFSEEAYQEACSNRVKIQNAEKLFELVRQISDGLEGGQPTFAENIRKTFGAMRRLNDIDAQTSQFHDLLTQLQDNHNALSEELSAYAQSLSFDPQEAENIYARYDMYEAALKKYGPTLADAEKSYNEAKTKFDQLNHWEENTEKLKSEIRDSEKQLGTTALKISKKRKTTAEKLIKMIEQELTELGIKNVRFDVRFEKTDFTAAGCDRAVFYISPNAGHDLKPLAEIVSSGEAARVMLALKKALINVDPIPTLIFDEIDAQIGGRLGTVTGQKLKDIASHRQVILITHLPQIASFADQHFKITKDIKDGRAVTRITTLNRSQRVEEMAEMMSGHDKNTTSLRHAEEMLSSAATGKSGKSR